MSRIAQRFAQLHAQDRKAFVPYLTAGDPDLETTFRLALMLADEGADVLELGVPFTDPIADGPVNQRAAQRALERGVTPASVMELVGRLRSSGLQLPIVLFTYANPVLQLVRGKDPAVVFEGIDGMLVTDLPPEESGAHIQALRSINVDTIFLTAPTTPPDRLPLIAQASSGFIYVVSSKGVTGARAELPADLEDHVGAVRAATELPICVGFGISDRATAARVLEVADGFVVGSALGRVIEGADEPVAAARRFVRELDPR